MVAVCKTSLALVNQKQTDVNNPATEMEPLEDEADNAINYFSSIVYKVSHDHQ